MKPPITEAMMQKIMSTCAKEPGCPFQAIVCEDGQFVCHKHATLEGFHTGMVLLVQRYREHRLGSKDIEFFRGVPVYKRGRT